MTFVMACACGATIANIYYAQPLISTIARDVGIADNAASVVVTLNQIGYCCGLLFLVPLGDRFAGRTLMIATLCVALLALLTASNAESAAVFCMASFLVGLGSTAVQMIVPMAAHLSPEATRGRVVGNVMSGLLTGIMLARPISSYLSEYIGWRGVYALSALLMLLELLVLRYLLPLHKPGTSHRYRELIASLWTLLRTTPLLQRRAAYQAALFAAFSLYWTAVPLVLLSPTFGFTQQEVALFALAGVAGSVAAPVAGHWADKGRTYAASYLAIAMVVTAFVLAWFASSGNLPLLVLSAILLDLGVQANLVLGQRAIYALGQQIRSRLNALYMGIFFAGGAVGSACASVVFVQGGWPLVCIIGMAFPGVALTYFAICEPIDSRTNSS